MIFNYYKIFALFYQITIIRLDFNIKLKYTLLLCKYINQKSAKRANF